MTDFRITTGSVARRGSKASTGCLVLFALPFLLVGLFAGGLFVAAMLGFTEIEGDREAIFVLPIFALVFGGVGAGLIVGGIVAGRKEKEQNRLRDQHPEEPWLWNAEWASGRIRSSSRGGAIALWIFGLLWTLISSPVIFLAIPQELEKGNRAVLVALLFPLVGLAILAVAARATIAARKFGDAVLELDRVPGVLGGPLRGRIRIRLALGSSDRVRLVLTSIHRWTSGSGKNRSTREEVLWQDERDVAAGQVVFDGLSQVVPVEFAVPFDCEPTDATVADDQRLWRLRLVAELPGVDADIPFEVPVFRTPESRPDLDRATVDAPSRESLDAAPPDLSRLRISVAPSPDGGTEYRFPMARNVGSAIAITIFTAIWCGAVALMIAFGAPKFFPVVFGLIGALLAWGTLEAWFRWRRVVVRPPGLLLESGMLGVYRAWDLPRESIRGIAARSGMQQSGAGGTKVWYDLQVELDGGRKRTLAGAIPDKRAAEWLAARWREDLGLSRR